MGVEERDPDSPAVQKFAKGLRPLPPTRCLHYRPSSLETNPYYESAEIEFLLLLYPDGAGIALHTDTPAGSKKTNAQRVDYRWEDLTADMPNVLTTPSTQLLAWCDLLFEQRINSRLPVPFLDHMQNVPLTWTGGSEKVFRSLARAICLTEPEFFEVTTSNNGTQRKQKGNFAPSESDQLAAKTPVVALYEAATKTGQGGFLHLERFVERVWPARNEESIVRITSPRLKRLGALVFRLNPFVGRRWVDLSDAEGDRKVQCMAARVSIPAEPPTAHEKAEAFLLLTDWLDENLTDPGERTQFGLPPQVE